MLVQRPVLGELPRGALDAGEGEKAAAAARLNASPMSRRSSGWLSFTMTK